MSENAKPIQERMPFGRYVSSFEQELQILINRHSMENDSWTPDFILAEYLVGCLRAYNAALRDREAWHGRPVMGTLSNAPSSKPLSSPTDVEGEMP